MALSGTNEERDTIQRDLHGDTFGLKQSQIRRLLNTYRRRVDPDEIVGAELARHLCELSRETGRQVGILIDRKGGVESVVVGNAHKLDLPDIGRARAGQVRLRGLRLVHTHLREEPLSHDDLTDLARLRLDLVAALGVTPAGEPGALQYAHLLPENPQGDLWRIESAPSVHEVDYVCQTQLQALESELSRDATLRRVDGSERAILVGFTTQTRAHALDSLLELKELARSAGVTVVDSTIQVRRAADPKYLVGRGKLEDLVLRGMQALATLLIFDQDLTPSQARHIGETTSLKVIDRTQLILDIFAQHAKSADGKLQVELAQLKYTLPRLSARDDSLSRLTGGIGGRGPGETKLEIDRRRVRERIAALEAKIDRLSSERTVRRSLRNRRDLPVVSIVGYTNAGKSTLLNALTKSEVLVEDKLFATLDPASRRLRFPRDREVIVTDTVGFIRDLPEDLVAAFRATLEELRDADLLLHVVDASEPNQEAHIRAVDAVLSRLGLTSSRRLMVFNKADALPNGQADRLAALHGGVAISALDRSGFDSLLARIEGLLWANGHSATLVPPEAESDAPAGTGQVDQVHLGP
jgi:GTPase